ETSFLQHGAEILRIILEQGTGHTVTDSASLAGHAAAGHAANDIKLLIGAGEGEGLTDNILQGIKAKIIVDVTVVDGDLAGTLIKTHSGYAALAAAGAVEIRCRFVHRLTPPLTGSTQRVSGRRACARCRRRHAGGSWRCGQWSWRGSFPLRPVP